ncbi:MAG: acetate kinase, partial [Clostridia bacterium]|nr:acetate kinase [Clostridia bacterium]
PDHATAIRQVLKYLTDKEYGVISDVSEISAIGHRVVNGGEVFPESTLLDEDKINKIEELTDFAPLHNPPAVTGMRACVSVMGPDVPQVAVFDTSFHQTMPDVAAYYSIPKKYYEQYGIRRFGAHGTSHKFVANECAKFLGKDIKDLKIVTCHLGNGSSITAVDGGKSIDTSMGFTPLAGVMMGTRSGDIDPSIVTYIMDKEGLSPKEVNAMLNKQSGALGVSGFSSDFRDIENAALDGNKDADYVLRMLAYQVAKFIGSYAMAMGGLDAVVFTAGLGENNTTVRKYISKRLGYIEAYLDEEANKVRGENKIISTPDSKVKLIVIPTNEELAIAEDVVNIVCK